MKQKIYWSSFLMQLQNFCHLSGVSFLFSRMTSRLSNFLSQQKVFFLRNWNISDPRLTGELNFVKISLLQRHFNCELNKNVWIKTKIKRLRKVWLDKHRWHPWHISELCNYLSNLLSCRVVEINFLKRCYLSLFRLTICTIQCMTIHSN